MDGISIPLLRVRSSFSSRTDNVSRRVSEACVKDIVRQVEDVGIKIEEIVNRSEFEACVSGRRTI